MMRALELRAFEGPGALEPVDAPDPVRGDASVLVDVRAVGINFPDLLTTKGQMQNVGEPPFIPGIEVAGVVRDAPPGGRWSAGDAVAAYLEHGGGYAEQAVADEDSLVPIPAGCDFGTGVGLLLTYHAAYFALTRRGRLAPGETVLVLGAGGGVGSAAAQLARALGARVIAGVAHEGQVPVAAAAGADETVVLAEGFSAPVRELAAGGVDIVLDPVGGDVFAEALRCLAPEGRLLVVGFAAGDVPRLATNRLLLRNIEVAGVSWRGPVRGGFPALAETGDVLARLYEKGQLAPLIGERLTFSEIPAALGRLERGEIPGKAVAEL
jgi:NADPH2:quinone reductase